MSTVRSPCEIFEQAEYLMASYRFDQYESGCEGEASHDVGAS